MIAEAAGDGRVVVLDPDFEAVAGLHGSSGKPERAWRRFADKRPEEIPAALAGGAESAVSFVRSPAA